MNRNSIIGFLLIAAIMVGYTVWMTPSDEELAEQQRVQDSTAAVNMARQIVLDSIRNLEEIREEQQITEQIIESPEAITGEPSDNYEALKNRFDVFANSAG